EKKYLLSASESVASVIAEGNLVMLESTVAPNTTFMLEDLINEKSGLEKGSFHMAHCPERVIPGSMLRELRENDRLIGTESEEGAKIAREIYENVLTKGSVRITNTVTAEMAKLVENTFRDINIAFANELSIICDKLKIDTDELISLANCHPRVNIHTPGIGVGGHCIPVVPWFICEHFPEDTPLIKTARRINDYKTEWTADKIELSIKCDRSRRLCVLGLAYKQDTDDLRDSAAVTLANILKDRGYKVRACEPNAPLGKVMGFENISLEEAIESGDFLVIAIKHREFSENKEKILEKPHYAGVKL
ncbi:MAG: nucleotide sugar dehydrogenase, partial [Clostridiales bacterium]|nr:nucleotide sugar dehydrogenase [Clostridiales bacterium]